MTSAYASAFLQSESDGDTNQIGTTRILLRLPASLFIKERTSYVGQGWPILVKNLGWPEPPIFEISGFGSGSSSRQIPAPDSYPYLYPYP